MVLNGLANRELHDFLLALWKWFPLVGPVQVLLPNFYPAGKTNIISRLNLPGKLFWFLMEITSPFWLLFVTLQLHPYPTTPDTLPTRNAILLTLYLIHYTNRAIIYPYLAPSMGPMHILVVAAGFVFNFVNPYLIGTWLAGVGKGAEGGIKTTQAQFCLGLVIWALGFAGNIYHEYILRSIRRATPAAERELSLKEKDKLGQEPGVSVHNGRVYRIPRGGLFGYVFCPHYFCEWVEWTGFAIAAGGGCAPAVMFVVNEVATMLPRAVQQRRWYVERFGEKEVGGRRAVVPGVI